MNIGEYIKQRRKQLGMSAENLAEEIKKSPSTVYRYENGDIDKIDLPVFLSLAEALNVSPIVLMSIKLGMSADDVSFIHDEMGMTIRDIWDMSNGKYTSNELNTLDKTDVRELVDIYDSLNDLGQSTLMGTARGLAANPDMKKDGTSSDKTTA